MKKSKKTSEKFPTIIDLRGEDDLDFFDTATHLFSEVTQPGTIQDANKLLHGIIIGHGCLIREKITSEPYKEILSTMLDLDPENFNIFSSSTTEYKTNKHATPTSSFSQYIVITDKQVDSTKKHSQPDGHGFASCRLIVNCNDKRVLDEEMLEETVKQRARVACDPVFLFELPLYQIFLKLRISLMNLDICERKARLVKLHGAQLFGLLSKYAVVSSYKTLHNPVFTDILLHFSKLMSLDLLYNNARQFNDRFIRSAQSSFSAHNRKLGLRKLDAQYAEAMSLAKRMWDAGDKRLHWEMARYLYDTICKPIELEIKKELTEQYPTRKSAKVRELFEKELAKRIRYETMSIEKLKILLAPIADDPSINKYDDPSAAYRKSKKS